MPVESLSRHWDKIQACQLKFPDLHIRLGLEMDYYPNREQEIKETIDFYEQTICRSFDIILGSVHEINGSFFSNKRGAEAYFPGRDILIAYREYFNLAAQGAESKLFDIMAHPDLIKKYTGQITLSVPFEKYISSAEVFISALIKNNVGIEVNTKGLKLPIQQAYPSQQFLELYLEKARFSGVEPVITLGSDAHKLEEVGFGIAETVESLKKLEVGAITGFIHRKKISRKI
jgi:histidinol-phosphatase (PHP family)